MALTASISLLYKHAGQTKLSTSTFIITSQFLHHTLPANSFRFAFNRPLLSLNQFRALSVVTKYGWKLAFVRREMLEEAIPVIVNSSGDKYAEIETMGGINLNPGIKMRG
jgi:hypothetical protein